MKNAFDGSTGRSSGAEALNTAAALHTEAPSTRESFSEWARRLRQSDRDAYAAVFKSMGPKLVRYAQGIIRDEAGAYDVIQDVFLKLWDIRENLNPDSSLQSLLYTMTRNASLNLKRKNSYLVHSEYTDTEGSLFDGAGEKGDGDNQLEANQLRAFLNRWIEELPERRREAFMLSRYHDLSHREISEIMGLSERTVNTHIFLALKHLRKRLDALQNDNVSS